VADSQHQHAITRLGIDYAVVPYSQLIQTLELPFQRLISVGVTNQGILQLTEQCLRPRLADELQVADDRILIDYPSQIARSVLFLRRYGHPCRLACPVR